MYMIGVLSDGVTVVDIIGAVTSIGQTKNHFFKYWLKQNYVITPYLYNLDEENDAMMILV